MIIIHKDVAVIGKIRIKLNTIYERFLGENILYKCSECDSFFVSSHRGKKKDIHIKELFYRKLDIDKKQYKLMICNDCKSVDKKNTIEYPVNIDDPFLNNELSYGGFII